MRGLLRIAAVQMTSTPDVESNVLKILGLIKRAKDGRADIVAFPENALFLSTGQRLLLANDPYLERIRIMARESEISVLLGTAESAGSNEKKEKSWNSLLFINEKGNVTATYRKIHLFDNESLGLMESASTQAGDEIVSIVHESSGVRLGFSICYDLRFPAMYQTMMAQDCAVIFAPSAFTVSTGRAHWRALLQCRAIETQSYIIAPAQWGNHDAKRESFGEAAIVSPYGEFLSIADNLDEQLLFADIDMDYLHSIRKRMPLIKHRRGQIGQIE